MYFKKSLFIRSCILIEHEVRGQYAFLWSRHIYGLTEWKSRIFTYSIYFGKTREKQIHL